MVHFSTSYPRLIESGLLVWSLPWNIFQSSSGDVNEQPGQKSDLKDEYAVILPVPDDLNILRVW
jgi:hypothetical protein